MGWIVGVAVAAVLVLACLSPLQTARWWPREGHARTRELLVGPEPACPVDGLPERFVVYLSGVGDIDPEAEPHEDEEWILGEIERARPDTTVIREVFPYAVTNHRALGRATGGSAELAEQAGEGVGRVVTALLQQVRNVVQALIAADPRYGPTYYADLARQVWAQLTEQGYRRGCGVPVTFLGYSGGAQMALGVSWLLTLPHVRCSVISLGGVYSDDRGFAHVEHFWDIRGSRDRIRLMGPLWCPGRWPINTFSTFHSARRQGRVTVVDLGPFGHHGDGGYFDADSRTDDGRSHAEATRDAVLTALGEAAELRGGAGSPSLGQ